ncbi:MAG: site-specific DNA-methyltransferase [Verrucomicrobiae bacterium]|nr:site-specific DNA-methyltransferase [Verrucomicrobiae bacterium]
MITAHETLEEVRDAMTTALSRDGLVILPPADVHQTFRLIKLLSAPVVTTVLDPWYNKGVGGVRDDYVPYVVGILDGAKAVSKHIFLWGFPEIIAPFVERIPTPLTLVSWLTWAFRNNPSVIRGWRSAQMTCLHLSHPGAKLYVEHFLNEVQLAKLKEGKLRYMPGPPSVIEESLLVGFVGQKEQTGHPSQKPVKVIEPLVKMTTKEGDLVLDPMSGSGTTAEAARRLGRQAIICDHSEEYTQIAEKRLGVRRIKLPRAFRESLDGYEPLSPDWQTSRPVVHYPAGNLNGDAADTEQMAFFERHETGGNGSRNSRKQAPRRKPRSSATITG